MNTGGPILGQDFPRTSETGTGVLASTEQDREQRDERGRGAPTADDPSVVETDRNPMIAVYLRR
jgi:hypothetical protein